jgi:hypothetical protein
MKCALAYRDGREVLSAIRAVRGEGRVVRLSRVDGTIEGAAERDSAVVLVTVEAAPDDGAADRARSGAVVHILDLLALRAHDLHVARLLSAA